MLAIGFYVRYVGNIIFLDCLPSMCQTPCHYDFRFHRSGIAYAIGHT